MKILFIVWLSTSIILHGAAKLSESDYQKAWAAEHGGMVWVIEPK
jgi:hypothetical protein|tara:strand:- start:1078 stop:1212 length:135 start_codon:yes stop_codon:yes gene_type:complete